MGDLSPMTLHLLSLLDEHGPMTAIRLTKLANAECVHDDFDSLPEIESSAGRLLSMRKGRLVRSTRPADGAPLEWAITEAGRDAWHAYRDGPAGPPPSPFTVEDMDACLYFLRQHEVRDGSVPKPAQYRQLRSKLAAHRAVLAGERES